MGSLSPLGEISSAMHLLPEISVSLDLKLPPSWVFQTSKDQRGGFPGGSISKEPACQWRRLRFRIPGLGIPPGSPGEWNGNPLQDSCLENSMDRGAWWATYSPWGCKESDTTERLNHLDHHCHQGQEEVREQVTLEKSPGYLKTLDWVTAVLSG